MVRKPHGTLKNPENGSGINLQDPTMRRIPLTTMTRAERREEDKDAFVGGRIEDASDTEHTQYMHSHSSRKVQFPEGLPKVQVPPAAYVRQETDAINHRSGASSIYGGDEYDSSDYDWSDEEDLVDEQAKFKEKLGENIPKKGWGPIRIVTFLLSSLIGSSFLSAVLITPALLVHFYWYKPHPTEHRKYVTDNIEAWLFWVAANLVVSWALALIIDIIPVLIRYIIAATWGHISESFKARIEAYDSVKNTAKPAFYAASAYASWKIIFESIFKLYNGGDTSQSRAEYTNRLAQVVEFFFFLVLVQRIQAMVSYFIAFAFHQVAYKERILEVETCLVVIEKLRQYRPKHQPSQTPFRSEARTPVSGSATTPLTNNQHYKLLSHALRKATETPEGSGRARDYGSAVEDARALNRLSWQNSNYGNLHNTELATAPGLGADVAVELETMPSAPSLGQVFTAAPAIPSHLNPNRYPPNESNSSPRGSPRGSVADGGYFFGTHHTPDNSSPGRSAGVASAANAAVAGAAVAVDAVDATIRQTAKVIKTAVLHDARNIHGDAGEAGTLGWNVHSSREAKHLARSIFNRFKDRGRSWLIPADFYPAFPDHASAEEAFKVFDKDGNGDLSRAEIKTALLKIYKERRFLSRSMRDVGEALQTLDRILLFFVFVVLFFIALSVFGVEVGSSLSSVYTIGIAASFIFKNSASSAFDAIMFLFVIHPYDTGDRVLINEQNLVVKRVGLFATVFMRSDGTETYYFNSQLFNQFILNMRRSGKTFENLTMQVAWTTPLAKLDALERSLNEWLSTEENRWFEPSTNIVLQNISFQRYLEITIGIGHNGNWQNWGLHNARRTAFHAAVHHYCRQLGIIGYEAPMPIVYANPATRTYTPSQHDSTMEDALSPPPASSPTANIMQEQPKEDEETERQAKEMKPMLGFLPPLADRSSHLARARKSKNRKENLGAGNG